MTLDDSMTVYLRDPYTEEHFELPEISTLRAERRELMRTQERLLEQIEEGVTQRQLFREEIQEARRPQDMKAFKGGIKEGFTKMTPQELRVLGQRYGLDGGTGATLRKIAEQEGLTHGRIRQIEFKALRKLRDSMSGGYHDLG